DVVFSSDLSGGGRFTDNGDGTITDHQTGLMWEKKTPRANGTPCNGSGNPNFDDIHCKNNVYTWSTNDKDPNGTMFTDFFTRINKAFSTSSDGVTVADVCFAGHCDWRLPNVAELKTLLMVPCPGGFASCWFPIFQEGSDTGIYSSSTTGSTD